MLKKEVNVSEEQSSYIEFTEKSNKKDCAQNKTKREMFAVLRIFSNDNKK